MANAFATVLVTAHTLAMASILTSMGLSTRAEVNDENLSRQNVVKSGVDINGNGSLERSEAAKLISQEFVGENGSLSDAEYIDAFKWGNDRFRFSDQSNYQNVLEMIRLSQELKEPQVAVEAIDSTN